MEFSYHSFYYNLSLLFSYWRVKMSSVKKVHLWIPTLVSKEDNVHISLHPSSFENFTFAFLQVLFCLLKQTWKVYHHPVTCNVKWNLKWNNPHENWPHTLFHKSFLVSNNLLMFYKGFYLYNMIFLSITWTSVPLMFPLFSFHGFIILGGTK